MIYFLVYFYRLYSQVNRLQQRAHQCFSFAYVKISLRVHIYSISVRDSQTMENAASEELPPVLTLEPHKLSLSYLPSSSLLLSPYPTSSKSTWISGHRQLFMYRTCVRNILTASKPVFLSVCLLPLFPTSSVHQPFALDKICVIICK